MIYWIWLTQIPFIGPVTTRYLIKELGDVEKIYQADHETPKRNVRTVCKTKRKYHQELFIGKSEKDHG